MMFCSFGGYFLADAGDLKTRPQIFEIPPIIRSSGTVSMLAGSLPAVT